jgi:hypothetical protein
LHLAEYWYNTSWHSALGFSPFQALYGHLPRTFGIDLTDACLVKEVADWIQDRELMQTLIKQHLAQAQERMKRQADKHRSERQFQVGDRVYLKLQLYVQSSLATQANQKLSFKFFGPFKILERIGAVAYKLQLPSSAAIHPVFHVSRLKAAPPSDQQVSPYLPDSSNSYQIPERVLQRRMSSDGHSSRMEVLVKWSGFPEALATWENFDALKQRFPASPALGLAGSFKGGEVSAHLLMTGSHLKQGLVGRVAVKGNAGPTRVWVEVNGSRSELACVCVSSTYELRLKAKDSGLRNAML